MVERWTCKYCNVTINDDAPSRAAHEGGLRHKSAVERALRQTYKKAERDRRDAAAQAREMAKIERAAERAGQEEDGKEAEASTSSSSAKRKRVEEKSSDASTGRGGPVEWKPTDKYAAYTTAANLGIREDPDAVREREEQELRQKEGFASEWSVVVEAEPDAAASAAGTSKNVVAAALPAPSAEVVADDDDDDLRNFKSKVKSAPSLNADDDEGAEAAPLEFKKRTKKRRT
ncbi:hypothetical protein V8E36_007962 [Tilletia maclaganii]